MICDPIHTALPTAEALHHRLLPRRIEAIAADLAELYPCGGELILDRLVATLKRYGTARQDLNVNSEEHWSERTAVLITYGGAVVGMQDEHQLATLKRFADSHLAGIFSHLHILPFFPWSSDDGFSVIDYRSVDAALGDWDDVKALSERFGLMFDLVLNHCSRKSSWFRQFTTGIMPYDRYFKLASADDDLSLVVRPRTSPLLSRVRTRRGVRHVWTTFSEDQVDLDWGNPDVFFDLMDIMLGYVQHGANIIRLDAIAFLWKEVGTPCLHLPQTHRVVKALRKVLELVAPGTLLLTETNVPHAENISYFGEGDEAHMVYNFALPPLLLDALLRGDGTWLTLWASKLEPPPPGCIFLNFTASHDGIGVRALDGLTPEGEKAWLADQVQCRGGQVSMRRLPDGSDEPYELNATWFSALASPEAASTGPDDLDRARFLCSQAVSLCLQGVPAIYFHSMFGSLNDTAAVAATKSNRAINRSRLALTEVDADITSGDSHRGLVFQAMKMLLAHRLAESAFHPNAAQVIHDLGSKFFVVERATDAAHHVLCVHNLTDLEANAVIGALGFTDGIYWDVASDQSVYVYDGTLKLPPYGFAWIRE